MQHGKVARADLEHRQVARRIRADQFRGVHTAGGEFDLDIFCPIHHVMIGKYVPIGPDNHARSERVFHLRAAAMAARRCAAAEKFAE